MDEQQQAAPVTTDAGQKSTATLLAKGKQKKASKKASANSTNLLAVNAHGIENLNEEQAHAALSDLIQEEGWTDFKLGGVIAKIYENSWHTGFDSFKNMIDIKYGVLYRKAMYLKDIYNTLVTQGIDWEIVKDMGWAKLKEIAAGAAPIITAENAAEWAAKAATMNVAQFKEAVKAAKPKATDGADGEEGATVTSTVSEMKFKLHNDQKETVRAALDKAKGELNTEFDTVALDGICTGYLGGSVTIEKAEAETDLVAIMKAKNSAEAVLEAFTLAYPDVVIEATV